MPFLNHFEENLQSNLAVVFTGAFWHSNYIFKFLSITHLGLLHSLLDRSLGYLGGLHGAHSDCISRPEAGADGSSFPVMSLLLCRPFTSFWGPMGLTSK